jgi:xanthine permease XanP
MSDTSRTSPPLLFEHHASPPWPTRLIAGLQHLMAVFGGIITAPLLLSRGMGLSAMDSNYLITSALLISGIATLIQVTRIGPVGSGLLSVQGTSFTFIGPILFAFFGLPESMDSTEKLAVIFGSIAVAALLILPLACFVHRLHFMFTSTVAGTTVFLIGSSLTLTNLNSLATGFQNASSTGMAWSGLALAAVVFVVTLGLSLSRYFWLRMTSIVLGFTVGFLLALMLGMIDFSLLTQLDRTFVPKPLHFGLGFDWGVTLMLLPIFAVSMMESIGDLTATSALSNLPTKGPAYWQRIRGGVMADAVDCFLAAVFATFPNVTFAQNNGVIRLTGIASRKVGLVTGGMLIVLGLFPIVGGLFQLLPNAVLAGGTLLMFLMVAFAGIDIIRRGDSSKRAWLIGVIAVVGGALLSESAEHLSFLHPQVQMLLQFHVSTGAFLAIFLELALPAGLFASGVGKAVHN